MAPRAPLYLGLTVMCHVCLYGTCFMTVSCSSTSIPLSTQILPVASSASSVSTMTIYYSDSNQISTLTSSVGEAEESSILSFIFASSLQPSYSSNYEVSISSTKSESKVFLTEVPTLALSQTLIEVQNETVTQTTRVLYSSMSTSLDSNMDGILTIASSMSMSPYSQFDGTLTTSVSGDTSMMDSESIAVPTHTATDLPASLLTESIAVPTHTETDLPASLLTEIETGLPKTVSTAPLPVTMSRTVLSSDAVQRSSFSEVMAATSTYTQEMTTSEPSSVTSVPPSPTSSITAQPESTTQPTRNDISTGTEVQGTTSTEQPAEFRASMLLLGLLLSCGALMIVVVGVIIWRCRAHIKGHDLEPLEDTEEILEPYSLSPLQTTESSTDETTVDLTRVENIPIKLCRPPPPPPPTIREPNDVNADDVILNEGQGQLLRNHGDQNDDTPRRDYWSYHDNGNIPMRTFKGSARVKSKTQSWGPTASARWDEKQISQPENVASSLGSKELLI